MGIRRLTETLRRLWKDLEDFRSDDCRGIGGAVKASLGLVGGQPISEHAEFLVVGLGCGKRNLVCLICQHCCGYASEMIALTASEGVNQRNALQLARASPALRAPHEDHGPEGDTG